MTITYEEMSFIEESNRIEGITREPTDSEIGEFKRFIKLDIITIKDLKKFVSIYAPGHTIRNKSNLNVSIGGKVTPFGGKHIVTKLQQILDDININGSYKTHVLYELLHPFTDGNGRSGRAIWAWQTIKFRGYLPDIGFLHTYYYQSLNAERQYSE